MTRFEWFDNGFAQVPLNLGILDADVFMKFIRYKVYLDFLDAGVDRKTAIELTAERNECDRSTIYRDLKWFSQEDATEIPIE